MTRLLSILLLLWSFSAVAIFVWHWPKVVWFTRWWGALCVARYRQPLRRDMVIRFFIVLLLSALGCFGQSYTVDWSSGTLMLYPQRDLELQQSFTLTLTADATGTNQTIWLPPVQWAGLNQCIWPRSLILPGTNYLNWMQVAWDVTAGKFVTNNQTYTLVGQGILFTAKTGNVVTVKTSVDLIHWQLQTNASPFYVNPVSGTAFFRWPTNSVSYHLFQWQFLGVTDNTATNPLPVPLAIFPPRK